MIRPDEPCPDVVPMEWRRVDGPGRTPSYVPPAAPQPPKSSPPATAPHPATAPDSREIETRIREAHAAGIREGEAAGRGKAAAEMQPVIERLARSIDEIAGLRSRLRREAEQDLIRLAMVIARRILHRELAIDPDALHGLILGALEKLQGQEICRVRVHPSHAAAVTACLKQMASAAPVEVIPDASREVGTVIFETDREVRGFLEQELGPEGPKKSVVVVATSERPAPLRVRACFVALAVAEYFRDQGANVLLVMDSVTRLAMAQREIGLAAGEPPSQKGYTPSVFNVLPKVLERAGNFRRGSITGFFTVLVEGDDFNEPICDAVRGILDGHIILSRQLAGQGHYPAIDILHSISRLTSQIATPPQKEAARKMREVLSAYRDAEDLIQLGAYVSGTNTVLDSAIQLRPELLDFLRQDHLAISSLQETLNRMQTLSGRLAPASPAARAAVPPK
jgi:hypothetical protein